MNESYDNMICAFWELVRYDLAMGNHATKEWLRTPDFDWWASTTLPIETDRARYALEGHWNSVMTNPESVNTYAAYRRWMRSGGMARPARHRRSRVTAS